MTHASDFAAKTHAETIAAFYDHLNDFGRCVVRRRRLLRPNEFLLYFNDGSRAFVSLRSSFAIVEEFKGPYAKPRYYKTRANAERRMAALQEMYPDRKFWAAPTQCWRWAVYTEREAASHDPNATSVICG